MGLRLDEVRRQWEKGLKVKCVLDEASSDQALVVLQSERNEKYHCHRYFQIGADWQVSVDHQGVDLEKVWKWLEDPKA